MIKTGTFRFILTLIVIICHVAPNWVFIGQFALICFFMLSGYWITRLYDREYTRAQHPVSVFYRSRLWRVAPMLLFFTILSGVVHYFFEPGIFEQVAQYNTAHKIKFWFTHLFTLGLGLEFPRLLPPAWSMDVELQFYILFPFIFHLITKFGIVALRLLLLSAAAITALLSWQSLTHDSIWMHTSVYYLIFFLAGIAIYYRSFTFRRRVEWCCLVIFSVVVGLMYLKVIPQSSRQVNELLPFLFIPMISNSVKARSGKTDMLLGNITYVIYLSHWVCLVMLDKYFHFKDPDLPVGNQLLYVSIYLLLTAALSCFVYFCIDEKINAVRKKWVDQKTAKTMLFPGVTADLS